MKITRTFYYQYGLQYSEQVEYDTNTPPLEILDNGNFKASIYMNIPFKVAKVHIKNMAYTSGQSGGQGNPGVSNYVTLTSSLVGDKPVSMTFRDNQFSMNSTQDIEHTFQIPAIINGYYDFTFYGNNGLAYSIDNSPYFPFRFTEEILEPLFPNIYTYWFDYFSMTIEFDDENELL